MKDTNTPLLTVAELEALLQVWGGRTNQSVDKIFPVKFWFVLAVAMGYCGWLLFAPGTVATMLATEPAEILRLSRFLYFRGWFLLLMVIMTLYFFYKNKYIAIFSSFCFMLGCMNFVFDLFNIYGGNLSRPTPGLTILLIIRIAALGAMYSIVRHSGRVPEVKDRFNIGFTFRR
jgi:hypothetical protein